MVNVFKALGDENRLRMINLLIKSSLCVCELETMLDMSQSNVSRHLSKLKSAGLISSFKEQQWVYYQISDEFKESGVNLLSYIESELVGKANFKHDDDVYKNYKENNFDCNSISENKLAILDLIYMEGK
ncbi:MAG: metalloregulator ArsR/SmtB family transcription factor [Acidaminobacteraceae bacterium]